MKPAHVILGVLGLGTIALGSGFALTNPDDAAFAEYAIAQLKTRGCKEMPSFIKAQCPTFVDENQTEIKRLLLRNSDRQDYFLFSIYETNLSVRSVVPELPFFVNAPTFHLRTVGVLGQFYIYEAQGRQPS